MSTSLVPNPQQPEVSAWMFFRALKASRLVHPEDVELLERRVQNEPVQNIIDTLTEQELLNDYQLNRLLASDPNGLVLGQYRILGELGEGGCGKVYKARHSLMERTVALKVIGPELLKNKHSRDIFLREVIACTRLNHPNIATAYDANEHDGQLYFVMEYVPGKTLHQHVVEQGPLPFSTACTIAIQTALALQHAHEQGLVHRDIKPANIILVRNDAPGSGSTVSTSLLKVVDFGLARIGFLNSNIMATIPCHEGGLIGTPAYIAPEQIRDSHSADIRSDLYSLGCTLYFALTGRPPFNGMSAEITLHQHLEETAEPITSFRPSMPPTLIRIIQRLMAKAPAQRFQTPNELIDALNAFALSGDLNASGTSSSTSLARTPSPASSQRLAGLSAIDQSIVVLMEPASVPTPEHCATIVTAATTASVPDSKNELADIWWEWRAAVNPVLAGAAATVPDAVYRSLYRKLLAAIREARSRVSASETSQYDALLIFVEPWVMLSSLKKLDASTRAELARQSEALTIDVWPESVVPATPQVNKLLILAISMLAFTAVAVWKFLR